MMSIGNHTKDTSTSGYFGFVQSNREQKHKTGVIPVKNRDSQLSMLYQNNIMYGSTELLISSDGVTTDK